MADRGVFVAMGNPNTIPHLTGEKLRVYRFPFPPVEEQRAIAGFLDRETAKIDELITGCSVDGSALGVMARMARVLKEYRSALIATAVTGKIDVRKHLQEVAV
jgi:type I restriction enzyme S subunit